MEKPRLSSKIEEVEYHGIKFKVKREFYVSDELGVNILLPSKIRNGGMT